LSCGAFTVNDFSPSTLLLFGEAYSKSDHLFHVPLRPDMLADEERRYRDLALAAMVASPGPERMTKGREARLRHNANTALDEIEYDPIHRRSLGLTPQAFLYFNTLLARGLSPQRSATASNELALADHQSDLFSTSVAV